MMDNVILLLGIINFLLVLFSVSSGMKYIKVSFAAHKRAGITLLVTAALHGTLALLAD
jgi:hypothetical protein